MVNNNHFSNFVRVSACRPKLIIGNTKKNADKIIEEIISANTDGVEVIIFPELCVTGYTCGDLFYQSKLLEASCDAIHKITEATKGSNITSVIGVPLAHLGRIYNCGVVILDGKIMGVVPKSVLPNTNEFYEQRWFASGAGVKDAFIDIGSFKSIPFGVDLLFKKINRPWVLGIEICEDLWSVIPPSSSLCLSGANIIANLSASNELVGKSDYRKQLVVSQSARCVCSYIYVSSGFGESSTDNIFSGHLLIAENGNLLSESSDMLKESDSIVTDIDTQALMHDRSKNNEFKQSISMQGIKIIELKENSDSSGNKNLLRSYSPTPFVPDDDKNRLSICRKILDLQTAGLVRRLSHTGTSHPVIGISGGLDSTLALLVTVFAADYLSLKRNNIMAITMPGFGTSSRTLGNVKNLVNGLGINLSEISIDKAVTQHFSDINHDKNVHDIVYENSQARQRTLILMNLANKNNGIVVGTGDLSESALGWCTYNGDHMSMYHVNVGVPKTLVKYIIESCIDYQIFENVSSTLQDILETPISPELLPLDSDGSQNQHTEEKIGSYNIHDFILYHFVRFGRSPSEIFVLASIELKEFFSEQKIIEALKVFYNRFFSQQFKRSAIPDGPKIGSVSLSPRGDWRMPSDMSSSIWLEEIEALEMLKKT